MQYSFYIRLLVEEFIIVFIISMINLTVGGFSSWGEIFSFVLSIFMIVSNKKLNNSIVSHYITAICNSILHSKKQTILKRKKENRKAFRINLQRSEKRFTRSFILLSHLYHQTTSFLSLSSLHYREPDVLNLFIPHFFSGSIHLYRPLETF